MKTGIGILFLALVSGCAGQTDPGPTCDPTKATGLYNATFTKVSGTCGNVGTIEVKLTAMLYAPQTAVVSTQRYSEDGCRLDFDYTFSNPPDQVHNTGYVVSKDPDGNALDGELTQTATGPGACTVTYSVTYARK